MADPVARTLLAVAIAVGLALVLNALPTRAAGARDLALAGYAADVAVLGVFAAFGLEAALVAAAVIVGVFGLGALIYALVGLAGR